VLAVPLVKGRPVVFAGLDPVAVVAAGLPGAVQGSRLRAVGRPAWPWCAPRACVEVWWAVATRFDELAVRYEATTAPRGHQSVAVIGFDSDPRCLVSNSWVAAQLASRANLSADAEPSSTL
jgi:hypothetical protein